MLDSLDTPSDIYPVHYEVLNKPINDTSDKLTRISGSPGNLLVGAKKINSYMYVWIYSALQGILLCVRHSILNYSIPKKNYGNYRASEVVYFMPLPTRNNAPKPMYDSVNNQIIALDTSDSGAILVFDAFTNSVKTSKTIAIGYKIDFWSLSQNCSYLICHTTDGSLHKIRIENGKITILSRTTNVPDSLNSVCNMAIRNDGLCIALGANGTRQIYYTWIGTSLNSYSTVYRDWSQTVYVSTACHSWFMTDHIFVSCFSNPSDITSCFICYLPDDLISGNISNHVTFPFSLYSPALKTISFEREDGSYEWYFPNNSWISRNYLLSSDLSNLTASVRIQYLVPQTVELLSDYTNSDYYLTDGLLIVLYGVVLCVLAQYIDSYTIT